MPDGVSFVEIEGTLPLPEGRGTLNLLNYHRVGSRDPNLFLVEPSGETLWAAAEAETLDKWVAVSFDEGRIVATSFRGYLCELNATDGSIVSTTFVK